MNGDEDQHPLLLADLDDYLDAIHPRYVILGGYRYHGLNETRAWCLRNNVPYALRADSNVWEDRFKGIARRMVRKVRLGPWVRRAQACLVTGTYNREYWQQYGMKPAQEGWWPQWIDYDHFATAREFRATDRAALRDEYDISCPINLLYVGRLIPRKRVDVLCDALLASDERIGLVVVGHGTEEEKLRNKYASRLGTRLRMLGATPVDELPKLYAACDVLGLASAAPRKPWALVVNEACAAGMPVVCHRHLGAAGDLVHDGRNGFLLEDDSAENYAAALKRFVDEPGLLDSMGRAAIEIADDWRTRSDPITCLKKI